MFNWFRDRIEIFNKYSVSKLVSLCFQILSSVVINEYKTGIEWLITFIVANIASLSISLSSAGSDPNHWKHRNLSVRASRVRPDINRWVASLGISRHRLASVGTAIVFCSDHWANALTLLSMPSMPCDGIPTLALYLNYSQHFRNHWPESNSNNSQWIQNIIKMFELI